MNLTPMLRAARIGVVYLALATVAIKLTRYDGGVAFLWPATSYLVAEMTIATRRRWPLMIAAAAFASVVATGLFGLGWPVAAPMAVANMLEAWLAAYHIRRHAPESALTTLRWFGRFTFFAALLPPVFSAIIASGVAAWLGNPMLPTFTHFYVGHALSTLTFAPIFILLFTGEILHFAKQASGRLLETAVIFGLSFAATVMCFAQADFPLLFLPVMPIILATFRLGRGGTIMCVLFLTLVGGAATLAGTGPLALVSGDAGLRVQLFQFYLAMTLLTAWPVAADLSHRSRLHRNLRQSEERYRMIAEHSSDILMQLSVDGLIRYVSPSISTLGGYEPEGLLGTSALGLIDPRYHEASKALHAQALVEPTNTHSLEFEGVRADCDRRWFETHTRAILDDQGMVEGAISIVRDITARKKAEAELSAAALTDSLTGLPNRRGWLREIEARQPGSGKTAQDCVAVMDIDHFKRVNDAHGHDAGDAVLRSFAALARRAIRQRDFIARTGGEEFVILFQDTSISEARALCESLREKVADLTTTANGVEIAVTVSGGVAQVNAGNVEAAIRLADVALYCAKQGGRDRLAMAA